MKREGFRRIAVVAAAPAGLYAVLVLISLLGGPRIGAPLIPLPGGGADATRPVAGPEPGQVPTDGLPPIPPGASPTSPSAALTTPLPSAPSTQAGPPAGTATTGRKPVALTTPRPSGTPTPELVERSVPPLPPATRTPPGRTTSPSVPPATPPTTPPATPPATPPTPSDPPTTPDEPKPKTLADILRDLAELLTP